MLWSESSLSLPALDDSPDPPMAIAQVLQLSESPFGNGNSGVAYFPVARQWLAQLISEEITCRLCTFTVPASPSSTHMVSAHGSITLAGSLPGYNLRGEPHHCRQSGKRASGQFGDRHRLWLWRR